MEVCWMCNGLETIQIRKMNVPCGSCNLVNFLQFSEQQKIKTIDTVCVDCSELITNNKSRCLPCHRIWQETETLCDDCGRHHHKCKYVRCYYCSLKKKMSP